MEKEMIKNVTLEKVAIMIDIMIKILGCDYGDAFNIIIRSKTYRLLKKGNYSTLHDSPQANLSSIGQELRESGDAKRQKLGNELTDQNIKKAMFLMVEENTNKHLV